MLTGEQMPDNIEKKVTTEMLPPVQESQKVEIFPDVSEFAQENISDIDADKNEIQNLGDKESKRIEEQYQPNQELSTTFRQKLEDIAKRAGGFTEIAKKGMQGAVVGASMLAATAGFAEGRTLEKPSGKTQEGTKIEELQKENFEKINFKKSEILKEKRGNIELITKGSEKEKERKNQKIKAFIEIVKEDFINHISGIEFFKKLTIEFNGDEKRAAEEQKKRIENVKSVNVIVIEDESEFNKKIEEISKKNKKNFSGDPRELKGGYNHDDHTIYSKMDLGIIGHELLHSETRGREGISENAKRILENSYLRQGFLNIFSDKYDDYFSDVAEMLPGKKALDLDLKEANIKKYGEKFTNKHYEKIMEEYEKYIKGEKSLLSPMSAEFIKRIKKENLGDVLDKIASNENQDKIVAV